MDPKKSLFLSLLGVVVLLVSIVLGTPGKGNAAPPPDRDVRVINTAAEAVPVQGSVQVVSMPQVQIAGVPAVQVTSLPTVSVTNDSAPLLVRDVDRATAQPYAREVLENIPAGSQFSTTSLMTILVPAGKRFVIETFTCRIETVTPQTVIAGFAAKTNNIYNEYFAPLTGTPFGGLTYFESATSVKVYADPGSDAWAYIRLSSPASGASVRCTFSGYLVDVP